MQNYFICFTALEKLRAEKHLFFILHFAFLTFNLALFFIFNF